MIGLLRNTKCGFSIYMTLTWRHPYHHLKASIFLPFNAKNKAEVDFFFQKRRNKRKNPPNVTAHFFSHSLWKDSSNSKFILANGVCRDLMTKLPWIISLGTVADLAKMTIDKFNSMFTSKNCNSVKNTITLCNFADVKNQ